MSLAYPESRVKLVQRLFKRYLYKNTPFSSKFMECINMNCYNDAANELYNLFLNISNDSHIKSKPDLVVRIVAATPDGKVYYDSRKGSVDSSSIANGRNNYSSWLVTPPLGGPLNGSISGLAISDNHNTRNAFIKANLKGEGKEVKPALNANKQPVLESRYVYKYYDCKVNLGVIALSIEEPIVC